MACVCCARLPPTDARLDRLMKTLLFTPKEVNKMYRIFLKYDIDRSGTIDAREIYSMIEEQESVFVESLFSLADTQSKEELTFSEFVEVVSTYCMFTKDDILRFCFFIFDKDKNGHIDESELRSLVEALHAQKVDKIVLQALDHMDNKIRGTITYEELIAFHSSFPLVLYPAFRIQSRLMSATMGQSFWLRRREAVIEMRGRAKSEADKVKQAKETVRRERIMAEVEERMGCFAFYFCCWKRQDVYVAVMREEVRGKGSPPAKRAVAAAEVSPTVTRTLLSTAPMAVQPPKGDAYDDSDYSSSRDDQDATLVNNVAEAEALKRRQALRKQLMKSKVVGVERPAMDLDRDRRERRRDIRGETSRHELVKAKDRYITQEEKASRRGAASKTVSSPTLHSLRSPSSAFH